LFATLPNRCAASPTAFRKGSATTSAVGTSRRIFSIASRSGRRFFGSASSM